MPPASVKLTPPRVPPWYVPRPQLERRLDEASAYRLTSVVAGAGYGKSTHLAARAAANGWAWYTVDSSDASPVTFARGLVAALRSRLPELDEEIVPAGAGGGDAVVGESLAAAVSTALDENVSEEVVLVADDVHELADAAGAAALLEGLLRYVPATVHLVLCSRTELPFGIARLRGRGEVLDIAAVDLAFTVDEVAELLRGRLGAGAEGLAAPLREVSGGWPAAVRLAVEVLAPLPENERARIVRGLSLRSAPLYGYLAEEVLGREEPRVRRLLSVSAQFDQVSPSLCETLGIEGAAAMLDDLARRGLATEPPAGSDGSYVFHDLVRAFIRETWPLKPSDARELQRRASVWFEQGDDLGAALRSLIAADDQEGIDALLNRHWQEMMERPLFDTLVECAALLSPSVRTGQTPLVVANALTHRGDFDAALRWLPEDDLDSAVVRALIHSMRGESEVALEILRQAAEDADAGVWNLALLSYHLMGIGRADEARPYVARAVELTSDRPRSSEFGEVSMVLSDLALADGDLAAAEAHDRIAVGVAAEVGNVLMGCAARARLASLLRQQGRLAEAAEEAVRAVELSDRIGFSHFRAWTSQVRGQVEMALGRFDEAMADLTTSVQVNEHFASNLGVFPLAAMGEIHRFRGELAQARSTLERAVATALRYRIGLELAWAESELACLICEEEPTRARELIEQAVAIGSGEFLVRAHLAGGWVELRRGDQATAAEHASRAFAEASRLGGAPMLAEALVLRAFAEQDPAKGAGLVEEALAIWRRIGDPLGAGKAVLALCRLGADVPLGEFEAAERTLRNAGLRLGGTGAGLLIELGVARRPPLAIQTLGRFAVLRDGVEVPPTEWQSRKARDLLKLLVARRGRATTRDHLLEALWPGEDPKRTSNRLSVALNVVRTVLDPKGSHGQDHYVAGDRDGVRLDLTSVSVDLEEFLGHAERGLRLRREGDETAARLHLEAAEAAYHGDFLEEDRYEEWATLLRDESRSTYLEVARALALAGSETTRYHLRILALDPYDEDTHLDLVARLAADGRHGEARRAYRRYVQRMSEIGVEPAGFPDRAERQPA